MIQIYVQLDQVIIIIVLRKIQVVINVLNVILDLN